MTLFCQYHKGIFLQFILCNVSDESVQPKKAKFLQVYAGIYNVTRACQAAGIGRQTHYDWLAEDPEYAKRFEATKKIAIGALEDVAVERAWTVSDTLMIFLLKAADPEKYRDRSHQQVDANVTVDMTLEQRMEAGRNRARPQAE